MKLGWTQYPVDIIACIAWSLVTISIRLLGVTGWPLVVLGLPFILFIPGYLLVLALFPGQDIDVIERLALSFGLSIAVVPLVGLALNYTPWGIRLEPLVVSLAAVVLFFALAGWYRWQRLSIGKRFTVSIELAWPRADSRLDQVLNVALVVSIVAAVVLLVYVIATPQSGERFTEFYLLGPDGNASGYPTNLTAGENATVIIGVANHEHRQMNYTLEIWLVNQSRNMNASTENNTATVYDMWYMDKQTILLNATAVDTDAAWTAQWERNYTFAVNRNGTFKLAFLLFTHPTQSFTPGADYPAERGRPAEAYREVHLWVTARDDGKK